MQTIVIRKVSPETHNVCGIRLFGGFDSERRHYPALPQLRFEKKYHLQGVAQRAQSGCRDSFRLLRNWVVCNLVFAKDLVFDGVRYEFDVQSFSDETVMKYLVRDVVAQVLDQ